MSGKLFRVTKKHFNQPAIFHNGKHYFVQEENLRMSEGVLHTNYCAYSRHYAEWQEDTIGFTDTAFLEELLQFAVKAKVISEIPAIAKRYLNSALKITYLTNACCENIANKNDLIAAGLPFFEGNDQEEWYPLTKEEEQYITDECVDIEGYDPYIFTGYSALHQGKKWLSLQIETNFGNSNKRQVAERINKELSDKASAIANDCGFIAISSDKPYSTWGESNGFFLITVLVPMAYAQAKAKNRAEWLRYVKALFD